jgi:hypothetical protein
LHRWLLEGDDAQTADRRCADGFTDPLVGIQALNEPE